LLREKKRKEEMTGPKTFTTHNGLLQDILETSSPGLYFLKGYITAVDALDQTSVSPPLESYFASDGTLTINGGAGVSVDQLQVMLAMRANLLSEFTHAKFPVRAYELDHGEGKRTVVCEAVSMQVQERWNARHDQFLLTKDDEVPFSKQTLPRRRWK
jgi:hypothetical protein